MSTTTRAPEKKPLFDFGQGTEAKDTEPATLPHGGKPGICQECGQEATTLASSFLGDRKWRCEDCHRKCEDAAVAQAPEQAEKVQGLAVCLLCCCDDLHACPEGCGWAEGPFVIPAGDDGCPAVLRGICSSCAETFPHEAALLAQLCAEDLTREGVDTLLSDPDVAGLGEGEQNQLLARLESEGQIHHDEVRGLFQLVTQIRPEEIPDVPPEEDADLEPDPEFSKQQLDAAANAALTAITLQKQAERLARMIRNQDADIASASKELSEMRKARENLVQELLGLYRPMPLFDGKAPEGDEPDPDAHRRCRRCQHVSPALSSSIAKGEWKDVPLCPDCLSQVVPAQILNRDAGAVNGEASSVNETAAAVDTEDLPIDLSALSFSQKRVEEEFLELVAKFGERDVAFTVAAEPDLPAKIPAPMIRKWEETLAAAGDRIPDEDEPADREE